MKPRLQDDDASGSARIGQMTQIGGRPHIQKPDLSTNAEKISTRLHDEAAAEGLKTCGKTRDTKF